MCVMNLPKNWNLLTPPYKGEWKIAAAPQWPSLS